MTFKPLMFAGTASNVGKSILTTAFCRIFKQDGFNPAPFKAQNMSLNSYATPEGLEIGRAQATQAEAAGIPCHTDMNPVLLKPTGNLSSQVILHGKPIGNQSAYDYFKKEGKDALFEEVKKSFSRLASQYNPVVMEGAGSITELNLKDKDIVNMRMALHANAAVILVADIDRGGIFASLYGSVKLLPEHERKLIKGIIVNKFRGDTRLFDSGIKILEEITEVPVLGVVPYFDTIDIDDEDSVGLEVKNSRPAVGKLNVCVIRLPRISNFTDFNVIENQKGVNLFYSMEPDFVKQADIIIIPGSKNTIQDLQAIYDHGLDEVIYTAHRGKKTIIGICGGYQMLGAEIHDPLQIESEQQYSKGLGLLPVITTLAQTKQTFQKQFYYRENMTEPCKGYEIHMGVTHAIQEENPVSVMEDGTMDGYYLNDHCWGSYIHGIFDNPSVLKSLFKNYNIEIPSIPPQAYKEKQYDLLADWVRKAVDVNRIYTIIQAQ
ncbi:cobyric acid synthase [Ohtaekwangia koreensis]|uniref:Cobyric acid synthase n=1 Tax=Ohtaekwangia koreensis TaxID=688867 RepID=A0A1T5J4L8_9BACT|nr:cobyric acid synthase [Ohtaekwangia koreensis]SKC46477.1 adenosylcobyric acid synthase (glutamine-hydrolysing) [Ohtaekwangia koreensis]